MLVWVMGNKFIYGVFSILLQITLKKGEGFFSDPVDIHIFQNQISIFHHI